MTCSRAGAVARGTPPSPGRPCQAGKGTGGNQSSFDSVYIGAWTPASPMKSALDPSKTSYPLLVPRHDQISCLVLSS